MTNLDHALQGIQRLGVDTAPVIHFIEANPRYDALVTEVFRRIADGVPEGVCSVITLTEVLVHPLRHGNRQLAQEYRNLLLGSPHFSTVSIDATTAETAADLRARYNVRTPDAIQIAAALEHGCQAFLTNDATLARVTELRVFVLDQLEL
jgi:predicted nucleic acid-binding protein